MAGPDAIGTYRVGPVADPISLDFALEAKCSAPENGVGVKELSRLLSRLRTGISRSWSQPRLRGSNRLHQRNPA